MAKKTIEEKMTILKKDILTIEQKIDGDKNKLQQKKKALRDLEMESTLEVVQAYNMSAIELKRLLARHASEYSSVAQKQQPEN